MHLLFDGELGAFDTLRFVEEKIAAGLWSLDVKTGQMKWSRGLHRLLGLEPNSVEPSLLLFRSMMHPEDRLSQGDIDRVLKEGISFEREFRIVQRDGRIRWVCNRGEPVLDGKGQVQRVIGITCDVTSKQNAVRELQATEMRSRTLSRAVSTIVWSTPADGAPIDMPEWSELTGQTLNESQGKGWLDAIHSDDRSFAARAWSQAVERRANYNVTYRLRVKDGTYRYVNARAAPVLNVMGEVKEWIGVLIDVFQLPGPLSDGRWLTGTQARAARAILNWTVKDVAEAASVSISTIRRLEESDGPSNLRDDIVGAIREAFEESGIEFVLLPLGPPAVRPKQVMS